MLILEKFKHYTRKVSLLEKYWYLKRIDIFLYLKSTDTLYNYSKNIDTFYTVQILLLRKYWCLKSINTFQGSKLSILGNIHAYQEAILYKYQNYQFLKNIDYVKVLILTFEVTILSCIDFKY